MKRYLLDTNIVSHLLRQHPEVTQHVTSVPMASLCMSSITEAELLFGLAKRPNNKDLHRAVHELLIRVESVAWGSNAAQAYGKARAAMVQTGKTLAPLDLLIASQALSMDVVLVTNDQAIGQLADLQVEDWTLAA